MSRRTRALLSLLAVSFALTAAACTDATAPTMNADTNNPNVQVTCDTNNPNVCK